MSETAPAEVPEPAVEAVPGAGGDAVVEPVAPLDASPAPSAGALTQSVLKSAASLAALRSSFSNTRLGGMGGRQQVADPLIYDFSQIDLEEEYEGGSLWERFVRRCYAENPPIPALTVLEPVLRGDSNSALLGYFQIGSHAPLIFKFLGKAKSVSELDVSSNSLTAASMKALAEFIAASDQFTSLNLGNNPLIGADGVIVALEELKNCRTLESLSLPNTGSDGRVGKPLAAVLQGCGTLVTLNASVCCLRANALDLTAAIAQSALKRLDLNRNELFYGGRRLFVQLGLACGRCQSLRRLDMSQNGIDSDCASALLKGLGEAPSLKRVNLSRNCIDEGAGRALSLFLGKVMSLKGLDISQNPILNATANEVLGQKKMEEEQQKPGGKKDKKPRAYQAAIYQVAGALGKAPNLKEFRVVGLVVDPEKWKAKLDSVGELPALKIITTVLAQ